MTTAKTRMLLVDAASRWIDHTTVEQLPHLLSTRDLLVVNDAATLPASIHALTQDDEQVEIRLIDAPYGAHTRAVLLGRGDYRTPTEHREPPPVLSEGAVLRVGEYEWRVAHVAELSPRLVVLCWRGDQAERFAALYRVGKPVQYSYVPEPIALWDVQTVFASRPWAVEMPSAARPISAHMLLQLKARGVHIATLTHAAGLSSTGDALIDAALPLPEHYEIPVETAQEIERTLRLGGRVIAVGTSVVRALEDSALQHGKVAAGRGLAKLVLEASTERRVVSGLLTGIHIPGESHYRLLQSFVDDETLLGSVQLANQLGLRAHEFGDAALIVPGLRNAQARAA